MWSVMTLAFDVIHQTGQRHLWPLSDKFATTPLVTGSLLAEEHRLLYYSWDRNDLEVSLCLSHGFCSLFNGLPKMASCDVTAMLLCLSGVNSRTRMPKCVEAVLSPNEDSVAENRMWERGAASQGPRMVSSNHHILCKPTYLNWIWLYLSLPELFCSS